MGRPVTAGRFALGAALVGTLATIAPPLAAQGFCFRGQPRPDCSGFLLFNFHGHHVLAENGRERVDSSLVLGPDGELVVRSSTHPLDGFTSSWRSWWGGWWSWRCWFPWRRGDRSGTGRRGRSASTIPPTPRR